MSNNKVSVLKELIDRDISQMGDVVSTKETIIEYLHSTKLNMKDKMKMMLHIQKARSIDEIYRYVFNSYLKYNKMGVISSYK